MIAAGVLFGNGELEFHELFKQAWLNEVEELPCIGDGKNLIPTIHVLDLAHVVPTLYQFFLFASMPYRAPLLIR